MRRTQSYFEKRLLLREDNFIRRGFYKEKKVLLEKKTSFQRKQSYLEKRLLREEGRILKRDFYEEKTVLF